MSTSKLSIQVKYFKFNKDSEKVFIEPECFIIKRKKKSYIITCHNYLPITDNIHFDSEKLNVCINSKWNELLILKENKNKETNLQKFKKVSKKMPAIGSIAYLNGVPTISRRSPTAAIGASSNF